MKKLYKVRIMVTEVGVNEEGHENSMKPFASMPLMESEDLAGAMTAAAEAKWSTGNRDIIRYKDESGNVQEVLP